MAKKNSPYWERYGRDAYNKYVVYLKECVLKGDKCPSAIAMKSYVWTAIGMEVSATQIKSHRATLRDGGSIDAPEESAQGEYLKIEGDLENQQIESLSERLTTVEQVLAQAKIDLAEWEPGPCKIKYYEMGSKGPDKKPCVTPMCSISVSVKRKVGWTREEFRKILSDDIRQHAPDYKRLDSIAKKSKAPKQPILAVLSIFDAHFGKLAWKPESGANYDLKICEERYMTAARDLLSRAAQRGVERIAYVVGNDFFHVDQGRQGLTSNGTPQDCDGRWQKAFRIGKECAIKVAEEASVIAPVDIIVVCGNHDAEKAFLLGEVLDSRFHKSDRVSVLNEPSMFGYYRYGKVLLGYVHGDTIHSEKKKSELPATMATDRPDDWAETTCREWHLGHIHHENETVWKYRTAEAIRDVVVRYLPSLSSTDAWHRHQNYKSVLAAEMHLYHKESGRYGYEVHSTTDQEPLCQAG